MGTVHEEEVFAWEICGLHGGIFEDYCLVGYEAM
jgi:hypothetical protein